MDAWPSCGGCTRPAAIRRAGPKIPRGGSPGRPGGRLGGRDDRLLAGHIGLVQGVRTGCLLQATGRDASELGGIARLFVDPGARRKGLARALLAAAVGHARVRGLQPVLDVVDDGKAAIALYEGSGWKLAGTETATWVTPAGITPTLRCYLGPKEPDGLP
jgi:GNAT superfamily N-acetyltransferase